MSSWEKSPEYSSSCCDQVGHTVHSVWASWQGVDGWERRDLVALEMAVDCLAVEQMALDT